MGDEINIHELVLHLTIGLFPEEKGVKQPIELNITLTVDTFPCAVLDDISKTVDYQVLCSELENFPDLVSGKFETIERLAYYYVFRIFAFSNSIEAVKLNIKKLQAVRFSAKFPSLTLSKSRNDFLHSSPLFFNSMDSILKP